MNKNTQKRKLNPEDVAISIDGVSKYFSASNGQRSMKQLFTSLLSSKHDQKKSEGFWVLNDISFQIKKGEFFGIVGRNGSGKSTLLKMIAGVYSPTKGHISVNGNLVPFIELGVGFNPELSGRDNVFLNGALLGFTRKEMEAMYDKIVSFAELGEHMDVKLKNFSSGMQVRLAFSIAIRAKTDILLIDEVLAVGDVRFQQKCLTYFEELKSGGQTVVFISHDMGVVKRYCDRTALLQDGKLVLEGDTNTITNEFSLSMSKTTGVESTSKETGNLFRIKNQKFYGSKTSDGIYKSEEALIMDISYELDSSDRHFIGLSIMQNGVSIAEFNNSQLGSRSDGSVKLSISLGMLLGGTYTVNIAAFKLTNGVLLGYKNSIYSFVIDATDPTKGGKFSIPVDWTV